VRLRRCSGPFGGVNDPVGVSAGVAGLPDVNDPVGVSAGLAGLPAV
jgi:hypothetical protein